MRTPFDEGAFDEGAAIKYRGTEERQDVAHVAEEPPMQMDQPRDMGTMSLPGDLTGFLTTGPRNV